MSASSEKIDVDQPLWDQSRYIGRWKHFAFITDCRTTLVPEKELFDAKDLCANYRAGTAPQDTPMKDVIRAKKLRDSAFHPDTDELMPLLGRMSFYLPSTVVLTTAMLNFYKTTVGIMLCQLANQTHAAIVNYTNRNARVDDEGNNHEVKGAFFCAIIASSLVAAGCRCGLRCKGPILKKLIPLCAVTAGNVLNLPIVRYKEIAKGIPIYSKDAEDPLMKSRVAAVKGISECLISRLLMSTPCLFIIPTISQNIKVYCFYQRRPWVKLPIEMLLCALGCLIAIPSALAIFPQCNSMNPELMKLCPSEYEEFKRNVQEHVDKVYYNKGL